MESSHPIPQHINEMFRGVRVLVLGASGFIGRWVACRLSELDAQITLTVRDLQAFEAVQRDYQIRGHVLPIDLTCGDVVRKTLRATHPTIVFNLCGYGIDRSETDPDMAYRVNSELVKTLCDILSDIRDEAWHGQHLVHAGSVLEYGMVSGDLGESSSAKPTTLYGQSKLDGTRSLAAHCVDRGLRGLTARLATVYGPGEHPGRLLPSLLNATRSNESITLTSGTQQRDFTFVKDVADGLLRLAVAQADPGAVVNLVTGRLTHVRKFVESTARILGIPVHRLCFGDLPMRVEEMHHEPISITRLRKLTRWQPPTEIESGIRTTYRFETARSRSQQAERGRQDCI